MSDSYQAIYDAVRSRISGGNIGEAVERAASNAFDISHVARILQQEFCIAAGEMARPSVNFKPTLLQDGDQWCAILGENLQTGLGAFGDTPAEAMSNFDVAFYKQKAVRAPRPDDILKMHDRFVETLKASRTAEDHPEDGSAAPRE